MCCVSFVDCVLFVVRWALHVAYCVLLHVVVGVASLICVCLLLLFDCLLFLWIVGVVCFGVLFVFVVVVFLLFGGLRVACCCVCRFLLNGFVVVVRC